MSETAGIADNYWERTVADDRVPVDDGSLTGPADCDVAIVGAGFTGLWAALHIGDLDPALRVVVVEQATVGFGASGRNGGFCSADFTHGFPNSLRHFRREAAQLDRLGEESFRELLAFIRDHDIECELVESGTMQLAQNDLQAREIAGTVAEMEQYGVPGRMLEGEELHSQIESPAWVAGLAMPPSRAVVLNPLKLARGLARVARERGVRIHTHSPVTRLDRTEDGVELETPAGYLRARHVIVATSAYSGWLPSLRKWFAPVYDYLMVSDPVDPARLDAAGLRSLRGFTEASNQFHYFRRMPDDRILWGGYDAIHHFGSRVGPRYDYRAETFERLQRNFANAFPDLADVEFPYRWGGSIDTTTKFVVTFGRLLGGRGAYVLGYTGHGVGATRWAAKVAVDMILRPDSELLRLRFVRTRPMPFPPEPLRSLAIAFMKRLLDKADRNGGKRGLMLRVLDRLGIGFDS